jgi:glyoxylase-like metal-dependent hydrolase (beta-lactamase superfamily II)
LNYIDQLNIEDKEITFLALTHTHYDHCQSAKKIKNKYHCKIIVSNSAVSSIKDGYTTLPSGTLLFSKLIVKT